MDPELTRFAIESVITVVVVFLTLQAARYTAEKSSKWDDRSRRFDPEGNTHMHIAKPSSITRGSQQVSLGR